MVDGFGVCFFLRVFFHRLLVPYLFVISAIVVCVSFINSHPESSSLNVDLAYCNLYVIFCVVFVN